MAHVPGSPIYVASSDSIDLLDPVEYDSDPEAPVFQKEEDVPVPYWENRGVHHPVGLTPAPWRGYVVFLALHACLQTMSKEEGVFTLHEVVQLFLWDR